MKHPPRLVWETVRDRLHELVPLLNDVESVEVAERVDEPDGTVRLVNLWKARPQVPAVLAPLITPAMLAWTDRAVWMPEVSECCWQIETHFLPDRTHCAGTTRYAAALGGRGTRIEFGGQFEVTLAGASAAPHVVGAAISLGVESFVATLIPRNFRTLAEALSVFLDPKPRPPS